MLPNTFSSNLDNISRYLNNQFTGIMLRDQCLKTCLPIGSLSIHDFVCPQTCATEIKV